MGTGLELDIVVGHEVVQFDADDGAGDVAVVNIMEMGEYECLKKDFVWQGIGLSI